MTVKIWQSQDPDTPVEADEVGVVLAALRELMSGVTSPIVRACLEEAHDDIAHLTGRDSPPAPEGGEADAA